MPTDPSKVNELLPDAPFNLGGGLSTDTGRELFVPLDMHERFQDHVISNRVRGIAIFPLGGPVGIGRTWTLAWLARLARDENKELSPDFDERWEAALVPGLGDGQIRDLYESIFSSTEYLRAEAEEQMSTGMVDPISGQGREGILNHAILNRESWAVLTGDRGRFPSIDGVSEKPKWTQHDVQEHFLRLWLRKLDNMGVDNLLILIDEFETTVTRLSQNKMTSFSNGLRRLYDIMEEEDGEIPNVEVILSATTEAVNKIDATISSQELPGWLTALQSRMARGFTLSKINEEEAKSIAQNCIDYRRTEDIDDPYSPYTEEAVEVAFEGSDGLTRRFGQILNEMYIMSYTDSVIGEETAQEAVEYLGYDLRRN